MELRTKTIDGRIGLAVYKAGEYFGFIFSDQTDEGKFAASRAYQRGCSVFDTYDEAAAHVTDYAREETGEVK